MHRVYINLDRTPERREWMQAKADAMGLSFERVPAVDGRALSDAECEAVAGNTSRERLSAAAIGCFLSHRKAWEIAVRSEADYTAIFEDDMHLSDAIAPFLASDSWIPRDADIVRLERHDRLCPVEAVHTRTMGNRRLHRLRGRDVGTGGYVISKECAGRLLREVTAISRDFDQVLFNGESALFGSLTIYKVVPALCVQDKFHTGGGTAVQSFGSEIDRTWRAPPPYAGSKFMREVRRIIRQLDHTMKLLVNSKSTILVYVKYR